MSKLNLQEMLENEVAKGYDFKSLRDKYLDKEKAMNDLENTKDEKERDFLINYLEYLITEDKKVLDHINENYQNYLVKIDEKFKSVVNYKIDFENDILKIKHVDGKVRKMPLAM